jgi:hypothetical protein
MKQTRARIALAVVVGFAGAQCAERTMPGAKRAANLQESGVFRAVDASSPRERVWGVTVDDVSQQGEIVESLRALARRPTVRVVFDEGRAAASYRAPVGAIHGVADVMGEVLDSYAFSRVGVSEYETRAQDYVNTMSDIVDIWEIGNEVNGEWLGATTDVVAKVLSGFLRAAARGKATALTLYFNQGCYESADHEMFRWVADNLPMTLRSGLDYVLVSYYEDDCNGLQPDWSAQFRALASLFPRGHLGFGECGTKDAGKKAAYIERYYGMKVDEPRFVGGYFWWYFRQDMVPRSQPLWAVLDGAMRGAGR